jgi:Tfp pilus assembly protein PilF
LKSVKEFQVLVSADGLLSATGQLAHNLDPSAQPYASSDLTAIRAYTEARFDADFASARSQLEQAVARDPGYGPAWVALAQRSAAAGDVAAARQVVEKALAAKVGETDRVRLQALDAGFRGDESGREQAFAKLSQMDPGDVNLMLNVAGAAYRDRRFPDAVAAYQKAAAAAPDQVGTWNLLAYAQAYAGDFEGAKASLEKYRQLAPSDPNQLDSLGDIHYLFGRFADAEKYYLEAAGRSSAFLGGGPLHKAAEARWIAGDQAKADELERRYLDARQKASDPLVGYRDAQWKYLTGRQTDGVAALDAAARSMSGDAAALARAELAAWRLDGGNRVAARQDAAKSLSLTTSPQIRLLALMTQAGAIDGGRPQIEEFARGAVPGATAQAARDQVVGWSLLFHGLFADAEPLVAAMERQAGPDAMGRAAMLRAWTLVRAGRVKDAAAFTDRYPLPPASGEGPLSVLVTPRWFFVRPMVLREQGQTSEASALIERYRKYANYSVIAREDLAQWDAR